MYIHKQITAFFLAYPRRCLLKSDGTSNIEGPTVVDEPAAASSSIT
jgi:hypothetical protein